jgi:spermidine synthase
MKDSNWDLDYRDGMVGESKVADLLHLDTVEVKTDRKWVQTGNLYIETECYYKNEDTWKPSGIRVSQATHWGFVLEDSVLIIPIHRLKEAVWEIGRPITCSIPPNPSRGYLITPGQLNEHVRNARGREIAEFEEHERWEIYG